MNHRLMLIVLGFAVTVGTLAAYSRYFPVNQSETALKAP